MCIGRVGAFMSTSYNPSARRWITMMSFPGAAARANEREKVRAGSAP